MSSQVVSFRFLQAVTNPVTDDQVTVGVLQWDGEHLRFVGDSRKLAGDRGRPTLRRALAAIRGQVKELNPGKPTLFDDVHVAFPVAEGDGSLLRWGQVRRGLTSNSERHFQELVKSADLAEETNAPHVGRREIASSLTQLGERYVAQFGERVRVGAHVSEHFTFDPPLSWQNHAWHHTIPMNLDVRSPIDLRDRLCGLIGVMDTAVPRADSAVVAYVAPVDCEYGPNVENELRFVQSRYASRLRLAPMQATEDGLIVEPIERMLLADVRMPVAAG